MNPTPNARVPTSSSANISLKLTRRQFARRMAGAGIGACLPALAATAASAAPGKLRAAIIGHTGHGNYGHDLDLIFNHREDVEVVAVADPDAAGRAKAAQRSGAKRTYADYREMLEREKPQLVSIAPRWTDEHFAMAKAALETGAHLFIEKPFTQTLAEADELLALARRRDLKIAVAHQMRSAPNIVLLKRKLDEGLLGELLEIRARGKQDARAGGEDLLVLGVHLFDLMRLFAREPLWCSARVLQGERDITQADARAATEGIGSVTGDAVFAQFAFPRGVNGTFESRAAARDIAGSWGMELIGSKGVARIVANIWPEVLFRSTSKPAATPADPGWRPLEDDPTAKLAPEAKTGAKANARLVDDWLAAIAENREPVCSGFNGMKAVEMAMAVFEAGLQRTRVEFPLANRSHPLGS
jgi:predicted dehydrogenase